MKKLLSMAALLTLMAIAFFPGIAQASWSFKPEYAGIPATTGAQPAPATTAPPATAPSTTVPAQNTTTASPSATWVPGITGTVTSATGHNASQPVTAPAPVTTSPVPAVTAPKPAPTAPATGSTLPASGMTADEAKMLAMLNQERADAGLPPLAANMTLTQLARQKSQDMLTNNYFAHESPTYGSAFDMMKGAGVKYTAAGENLAKARDAAWAEQRLLASPGHAANILNPDFTQVGIGVVPYEYGVVATQMFIGN